MLSMSNRLQPETEKCPRCGKLTVKQIIKTNFELMAPDQLGRIKPHSDFCDFLQRLKKANPGSDFDTFR